MKMLKLFFIALSAFYFSSIVEAHPAKTNVINMSSLDHAHIWVVSRGTRLVAGNPYQNDFYILDRNNSEQAHSGRPKMNTERIKTANKMDIAKIKLALNKALNREISRKNAAKKIEIVTTTTKRKGVTHKKIVRVTSSKTHFQIGRAYVYK